MKRRRLELVTCVSLVGYAAIVLAGQSVHWIPGWGCHCHSAWGTVNRAATVNGSFVTAIEISAARSSDTSRRTSRPNTLRTPDERGTVTGSDRDCPICHWFSMAQQQTRPVHLAVEVAALSSARLPVCEVRTLTRGSILPRGPPRGMPSHRMV